MKLPWAMKWVVAAGVALASACQCGARTSKLFSAIQIVDASGVPTASLDFGKVQRGTTATRTVRIRNAGAVTLTVDSVTVADSIFGVASPLPLSVSPSQERELALTLTPSVADVPVSTTATVHSNDPEHPTVTVSLTGLGVVSAAVAEPEMLNFGEVFLGETKSLTFTLTNAGSSGLVVSSAAFSAATGSAVSGELGALVTTVAEGTSVAVTVQFAPTAMVEVSGALELGLPTGTLAIPVTGRGIQAQPKLCFKFEGSGLEQCTDGVASTNLEIRFGSLCDRRVYPLDGGLDCALDGGSFPGERSGTLYVRNEGNTGVRYTMAFVSGQPNRCDGGASIDFAFANAPALADGGAQVSWSQAERQLPTQLSDAKPWETAPIDVTYRARSRCRDDGADLATVVWTRQGDADGKTRLPGAMLATLTGSSILSAPVPYPVTFTGNVVTPQEVSLVSNTGDGPVELKAVDLWQSNDGGATPHVRCHDAVGGPCQYFSWVSGPTLPVRLAGTTSPGVRVSQVLGQLAFGTEDGGVYYAPFQEQRVFAVVETGDPYTPTVTVPIIGRQR